MNVTKRLIFSALLAPLLGGPWSCAAEFEVLDRFTVDGYTVFRGSTDIPGGSFSVGGSTFVVKDGNVGIGTAGANQKLSVNGGIGFASQNDSDKKLYSPSDGTLQWMTHNAAGTHAIEISHQGTTVYTHLDTTGKSYIAANGGGNVGIGTTDPVTTLDVGGTAAIKIPVGTTEQRPASPVAGMMRFNSTANKVEFYNGSSWFAIGAVTATGGNTVTDAGGYRIHIFTGNGTFTVTNGGNVEYLVVAGGGAGGNGTTSGYESGGGGAGGFVTGVLGILPGSYPVTVGNGGAARTSGSSGENGGNSVFSSITAIGGGGGATAPNAGNSGGSGGGGSHNQTAGGAGTAGQGFAGATPGQVSRGGGGGGASGVGGLGGGGAGLTSSISGAAVVYAGGGGGSMYANIAGGAGGGGAGVASGYANGTAGTANTGGGGGGANQAGTNTGGGAGGSGIVIIRYSN